MSRLRSYAPLKRESAKVRAGAGDFQKVYAEVDARSGGYCEVSQRNEVGGLTRCRKRGVEHHHLYRPRRSHHTANDVVHICRAEHDRTEWPFARGRLCFVGRIGEAFLFALRYAASKFEARGQGQ